MDNIIETKKISPPYISWITFSSYLSSLPKAIPPRIDKTTMTRLSGLNQTLVMSTLTYLDLINKDGIPSQSLINLVEYSAPEKQHDYQITLKNVLEKSYSFLFDETSNFDLGRSSAGDFDKKFEEQGISGQTIRKCGAFFISAAKAAGITLSPYITDIKRRGPKKGSTPKTKSTKTEKGLSSGFSGGVPNKDNKNSVILPKWYENFKAVFEKLPDANKNPHWTKAERDRWIVALSALLDLYIEIDEGGNE